MSTIRCIYTQDPGFPATDQHPDAVRYQIAHPVRGSLLVDAIGGEPTLVEVDAVLTPPPMSPADMETAALSALSAGAGPIDMLKLVKAKVISDLAFRLGVAPGALTGAQMTAERQRIAAIYKAL